MTAPTLRCSITPAAPDTDSSELLVLGSSIGTTSSLWLPVIEALEASRIGSHLRILRFDLPGHGASRPALAPFSVEEIAESVLRLVDETGGGRFHYAGLSLGGAVGIALALAHPDRVASLSLLCTGARIATPETWQERSKQVRSQGTASLISASAGRWFAPGFLERDPARGSRALHELAEIDDESYALSSDALGTFDRRADLGAIVAPTLAIGGEYDAVTPDSALAELAAAIPDGRHATLADASHLAALEQPAQAAALIAENITRSSPRYATGPDSVSDTGDDPTSVRERGMVVRREVLGDEHVDRAAASVTPETAPFQDFITRYAWGEVWARDGLSRRDRSIATLASLTTGGHHNEIGMHIRAALRNGLTRAEITEVLLHTALYAGLPASNAAFAIARDVYSALDQPSGTSRRTDTSQAADATQAADAGPEGIRG